MATDGIQGLYRGFVISAVGIFIYRGFYFGLYDSLKPILLPADAGFLASFTLGYSKYSYNIFLQIFHGDTILEDLSESDKFCFLGGLPESSQRASFQDDRQIFIKYF